MNAVPSWVIAAPVAIAVVQLGYANPWQGLGASGSTPPSYCQTLLCYAENLLSQAAIEAMKISVIGGIAGAYAGQIYLTRSLGMNNHLMAAALGGTLGALAGSSVDSAQAAQTLAETACKALTSGTDACRSTKS